MKENTNNKISHTHYMLLRELEHRKQLESSANIGGIEWSIESNEFWWSDQVYKILQLDPTTTQPSLHSLISTIHPSDQTKVQTAFEKLTKDDAKLKIFTKTLSSRGDQTPIFLVAEFLKDEDKIIGYVQDNSELSSERGELLDTLSKYRGVMSGAGDAIILLSLEGGILEGNAKASELLEVPEDEFSSLTVEDIHMSEDLDTMMGNYQGILWGNTRLFQSTIMGKNGKKTPVEISGRPVDIGSRQVLVIILHDISLQKKAQEALKRSERRYRSLVDEAKEGILLLNSKGEILAANPKICETTGLRRSALLEKTFEEITDFDININPITLFMQNNNRSSIHMEGDVKHSSGAFHPTGFNVARYEDQGYTHFIVTAYDLTEVRSGEKDRLQLQKQLFQAQKQEMLGQLAGSLAHDFNNLLSPILLVSEMLMEDAREGSFLEKNLSNINQAAQRARTLVGRILDYTRPEENEPKHVDLRHELGETLELLRSSVPHTIKITDTYSDKTFGSMADPDQIHQIIMNIGMNAAQAIGEANGTISFSLEKVKIDENSFLMNQYELPEGKYGKLSVEDTGPGIPKEYLDEIFDPFFTTKTQTDGSGLGLSVVSSIAANHGGAAVAKNIENSGACISVYLPLIDKTIQ